MNIELLKAAEGKFMSQYPGGFESEEMKAIGKKHRIDKMTALVHEVFAKEKFIFPEQIVEDMTKVISKSSMVSLFEKPKFRDFTRSLEPVRKEILAQGLYELLHGNQEKGFMQMLEVLIDGKLAKWSLVTIIPVYYYPNKEIFVKPTTTKNVIRVFELEDIVYKPRPSYEFYVKYKAYINEMKKHVNEFCKPNNPAFTGFLMMVMEEQLSLLESYELLFEGFRLVAICPIKVQN